MVHDFIKNQNLRLAHDKEFVSSEANEIIIDDLKHISANNESDLFKKESIGFKK